MLSRTVFKLGLATFALAAPVNILSTESGEEVLARDLVRAAASKSHGEQVQGREVSGPFDLARRQSATVVVGNIQGATQKSANLAVTVTHPSLSDGGLISLNAPFK